MKSSDPPVKPAKKAGLMGLMMDVKTGAMPVTRSPSRKDDPPSTVEDIDEEHPFAPCEPPAAEKRLGNNAVVTKSLPQLLRRDLVTTALESDDFKSRTPGLQTKGRLA